MKLLDFGSVNIDHVYQLPHLVREGETVHSLRYEKNAGGKGMNQAVALAKAGCTVHFAGAIGPDGETLRQELADLGVGVEHLRTLPMPTGHALIQVDAQGRNAIILYGGANEGITPDFIRATLEKFSAGDWLLMQNEIACGETLLRGAKARGMQVALNPSPMTAALRAWPLEQVDWFLLNEIEGGDMTGEREPEKILDAMLRRYPACHIVLTLGAQGAYYADAGVRHFQPAFPVKAVDTTAAGDTFTGFFLQAILAGKGPRRALLEAARASAIAVGRAGAGVSIPTRAEVDAALAEN